jgi:hypothetical protein
MEEGGLEKPQNVRIVVVGAITGLVVKCDYLSMNAKE